MTEEQAQHTVELVEAMIAHETDTILVQARYSWVMHYWYVNLVNPGLFLVEFRDVQALGTLAALFGKVGAAT